MGFLIVGIGGMLGSVARYFLGRVVAKRYRKSFPLATFLVNITGAVMLGIVSSAGVDGNAGLLLADGFLGAYTTFSTFMYEGFTLFANKEKINAFVYIACSLLTGVIGYMAGSRFAGVI